MKRKRPHLTDDWQLAADDMLSTGYAHYLKPAKKQKHPQYWVIETLRPHIATHWVTASETMATGNGKDASREMTPRRLQTAINILLSHVKRHSGFSTEPSEVNHRIRNIRTGEIIPWEAIGSGAE